MMLVSINDIAQYFTISENTDVKQIKPSVIEAQEFELANALGKQLSTAISTAVAENPKQYNQGKTYQIGDKVFYNGTYYIATAITTALPTDVDDWDVYELMTFWAQFVKRYLCGAAMVRYLPYLGLHSTQFGLEQYNQEGFGTVSDKRRGELTNSVEGRTSAFLSAIQTEMKEKNYTFDNVVYEVGTCETRTKRKLNFKIIGANDGSNTTRTRYNY